MSETAVEANQETRQRTLAALLERYPEDAPGEHEETLNEDGTLPRYALVSSYEGRSWDGFEVVLVAGDKVEEALGSQADSYPTSGWEPFLLVDLDDGTSRKVELVVKAVLGDSGDSF